MVYFSAAIIVINTLKTRVKYKNGYFKVKLKNSTTNL